jgi:hypothetical protein
MTEIQALILDGPHAGKEDELVEEPESGQDWPALRIGEDEYHREGMSNSRAGNQPTYRHVPDDE